MGNLWLLIAAPAAVLAAILFWRVFDIQTAAYETHRAEVRVDKAQFDSNFAKAFDGKPDEKAEARLSAAGQELERVKKEQAESKAKARAEAKAQVDALDKLLGNQTTNKEK